MTKDAMSKDDLSRFLSYGACAKRNLRVQTGGFGQARDPELTLGLIIEKPWRVHTISVDEMEKQLHDNLW